MRFNYRDKMKQAEVEARRRGHITILPLAIRVMEGLLDGTIECSPEVRRAAMSDALSRFGAPVKTQMQVDVDLTKKYVELSGYRDDKGEFHAIPWDDPAPLADVVEPPQLESGNGSSENGHGADSGDD